jgi:ribosomal protein S18 acetylase RimI-like enzyme
MVSVRRAGAQDAETISALNADVQAIHAEALPWRFKPPGPETFTPADAVALMATPNHLTFLAEVEAAPAGYAVAEVLRRTETGRHYAHETVYLHHISVRPAFRRNGVGSALIAAVREAGRAEGIEHVALDMWSFNDAARRFFQSQGFRLYNERMWTR